mgnify:CR=1 FL=1
MTVSPFPSVGTSSSGMRVYQTWIDAISDNIANLNTVRPTNEPAYQERFVVASSAPGTSGAQVDGIAFGPADGQLVYQPDHPYADANGMVRVPGMDLSTQMTNLIIAQRAYQANVTVFERARDAYQRALEIGH